MLTHRFTVRQTFRSSRASSSAVPLSLAFLLFSPSLLAPLPPPVHISGFSGSLAKEAGSKEEREKGDERKERQTKMGEKARNIGACAVVDSPSLSLAPLSVIRGEWRSEYERVATEGAGCPRA